MNAAPVLVAMVALAGTARAGTDLPPAGRLPSACTVRITVPRPTELQYGMSDIAAEARCPEGEDAASMAFFVDGRVVGEMARPPWKTSWDAGSRFASRLIEVRLVDRSGRMATDRVLTPGATLGESVRVTATPPDVVELSVSVVGGDGVPLRGLTREDFTVREEGRVQDRIEVRPEDRPLSVAILVDVSGSMQSFWPRLRESAPHLAEGLRPEDEVKLVAFSGPAFLVQDFTRDPARVRRSMERFTEWGGGTSLYDTLAAVGTELAWGRPGRQVVVLITDGLDTLSRIDAPRLRGYLRRTDVTVETLALPPRKEDAARAPRALHVMKQIAHETGGDVRPVPDPRAIGAAFTDLARSLQDRYCVSWPSDSAARGGWRAIDVSVRVPGAIVHARSGRIGTRPIGDFLIDDLKGRTRAVRRKAAEWLGTLPVEGGREALLGALGDHASEVRAAAAVSLGRLREPRAIEPLVAMLWESDPAARQAAEEGLRALGPPAVPALIDALERAAPRRRIEILPLLAGIGDARALDAIERLAQPAPPPAWTPAAAPPRTSPEEKAERAEVRIAALAALGEMESPTVIPTLVKGARDPEFAVRAAALRALEENGSPAALVALEVLKERTALLEGLAMLGRRGRLAAWLASPDAAALFVRTANPGTPPTPDGPPPRADLVEAMGGPAATADFLDLAARALPPDSAFRARSLAAAARGQAATAGAP